MNCVSYIPIQNHQIQNEYPLECLEYYDVANSVFHEVEVSGEIDMRGMASDEAILELDRYIDNALVSGLETIRIIHGKGTGVLRKSVPFWLGMRSTE